MNDIKWTITPQDLLDRQGVKYKKSINWLSVVSCLFCQGGRSGQQFTFGVHALDGNFNCLRATCDKKGSFWKLLEHFGLNPRDFIDHSNSNFVPKASKKKEKYVYHRRN